MKKFCLLLVTGLIMFATVGCGGEKQVQNDTQMLVVERQYVKLDGASPEGWDQAEFVVDVPVSGGQPLLDSLKVFLNETLYDMFEIGNEEDSGFKRYRPSDVYTDDMPNLLAFYTEQYRNHMKKNLAWFVTYNIFLIAQTESFVTYGVECYHGSGSTGSEFFCYTFDKKDGHRVNNIIAKNGNHEAGLLFDGLLMIDNDRQHYTSGIRPYEEIMDDLSEEAKALVENKGKAGKWTDCFYGERLAMINTNKTEAIVLIVRPAKHSWSCFSDDDNFFDIESEDYGMNNNLFYVGDDLMAFYVKNGKYTPANVLDGDAVITRHWDTLYSTNPNKDVFAFDPDNNRLYVPFVENMTMGNHECNDKYSVYRYNNFDEFVYEGEDGGFWLHPSVRQFGRFLYAGKTKDYLVRIDEMRIYDDRYDDQYEADLVDTCRYRYAAWNNKGSADEPNYNMLDNPDIVIYNGYMDEGGFVFLNNGYKYVIQFSEEDDSDASWLLVYHGDKLLYKKCLRSWDFKSTVSFDWDC